jgi:hypothetical protein
VRVEPPKENFLRDQYKTMYAAGLAEGIRRCREAVEQLIVRWGKVEAAYPRGCPVCLFKKALAAIDAVEGE